MERDSSRPELSVQGNSIAVTWESFEK